MATSTKIKENTLQVQLNISHQLFKNVCGCAHISYWANLNKSHWSDDILYLYDWDDQDTKLKLDYDTFCKGITKIFKAECDGTYKHRYHNVVDMLTQNDYDACYADDVVQFCLFGKIVYCQTISLKTFIKASEKGLFFYFFDTIFQCATLYRPIGK